MLTKFTQQRAWNFPSVSAKLKPTVEQAFCYKWLQTWAWGPIYIQDVADSRERTHNSGIQRAGRVFTSGLIEGGNKKLRFIASFLRAGRL